MNLDTILWLVGLSAEAGVVVLCIRGRLFRITPVFCSYLVWCLLNDILLFFLNKYFSQNYFQIYLVEMIADSVFQFAVLVELGWAVLRPIRSSLPRYSILILTFLVAICGAMIWPISAHMIQGNLTPSGALLVHAQQTIAVLRVVIFMALAGFSQLLSIGWRNRELQIATGLGFYSMFSLADIVHPRAPGRGERTHLPYPGPGRRSDYDFSLVYWIVSFAQQEQERQEFTPQMQNFLLAMTGAARSTRVALANSGIGTTHKSGKP